MQEDRYACRCCACGQTVYPYPLDLTTHRALRAYPIVAVVVDEHTGEPHFVHYLKCTRCLSPDSTERMERWERAAQRLLRRRGGRPWRADRGRPGDQAAP